MQHRHFLNQPVLGAALATLLLTAACTSGPVQINNPMDGDKITVGVDQVLSVKLTDMSGAKSDWSVTAEPSSVLKSQGRRVVPAANGSLPLEIYEFVGLAPGEQQVTFAYHAPGQSPHPDEMMTVTVAVRQ
jgi:predicted secreted protein